MKIELCEDNGFLNNGTPTLVVLMVKKDDGSQVRLPYEATKTIQQLYADVNGMVLPTKIIPMDGYTSGPAFNVTVNQTDTTEIERSDIVECVKALPRDDGIEGLEVGKEYRVIDIYKKNKVIAGYDVMDDAKGDMIRIGCMPEEIKLKKKFIPPPPRKQTYEIIKRCVCGEDNALELKGDKYSGKCISCGVLIEVARGIDL